MLNDILGQINDLMYTYLLLFLLLGTGLYFSIRSRFAQVRLMKEGFRILTEKAEVEDGKRQVSSFQALMIPQHPCRNRKYRRNRDCYRGRRTGSGLLDVGDGCNRRCFCIYRKYTGTGI